MKIAVLPPASREEIKELWKLYYSDESNAIDAVNQLKEWLWSQPHLPKVLDDGQLERWLIRCKNSQQRARQSIDMYYTLKAVSPEYVVDRNTHSQWFQDLMRCVYCVHMPQLTENKDRLSIVGFQDYDPGCFNADDAIKAQLMVMDMRLCEDYHDSNIIIIDMKNYTLGHVGKINISHILKSVTWSLKGCSFRVRKIHIINMPKYAEYLLELVKTTLPKKQSDKIIIHGNGLSKLHKEVPKNLLPDEYGGSAGPLEAYWAAWKQKAETYNDWFKEQESIKSDESKRQGRAVTHGDLFGFEGSFRKLTLD
ncbi:retinol-binding protein pinta-like isoform X2 [Periplaneta americana]